VSGKRSAEFPGIPTANEQGMTGYEADIVAVTGDPVKDITRLRDVTFVMKAGRVLKK